MSLIMNFTRVALQPAHGYGCGLFPLRTDVPAPDK